MIDDAALQREVLMGARYAFVPMPDTRVIDRPGWMQLVTPSLPRGPLNEVSLAVLAADRVDAVIDGTLAEYRELGLNFRWTIGPDSAPADLGQRLESRGLRPARGFGLIRDVGSDDAEDTELGPGLTIEPVDERNVDAFTEVMVAGWGAEPETLTRFHLRVLAVARERLCMRLARVHGQPVGAAAVSLSPRSAYLMGAVVLPEHRGRGIYRALVASRLHVAARAGVQLVTSHARAATSAPILRRLGFREVCELIDIAVAAGCVTPQR